MGVELGSQTLPNFQFQNSFVFALDWTRANHVQVKNADTNGEAAMDLIFIALAREGQSHKRLINAG